MRGLALAGALALVAAACAPGPGAGGQIAGTQWVLGAYRSNAALLTVSSALYADATFDGTRVSGFSGCNDYRAVARASGRALFVSQAAATTGRVCDDATMGFERGYRALLDTARWYGVWKGQLTVYDATATPVLVFDAAPRNPLLGKWVVEGYAVPPSSIVGVLPGAPIDVVFGIVSVGGFAGCNTFDGSYGTNGDLIRVSPLATTQMACAPGIMTQEAALLEALQGASRVEARGSTVDLTNRDGQLVLRLARPAPEPVASPSPSATPSPTEEPTEAPSPTPEPTEEPTAEPTEAPTPTPTPSPTPAPTAAPTAAPTTAPSPSAPPSFPPSASCTLSAPDGAPVATLVYPGGWFTVTEPPEAACRYFDPEEIVLEGDPPTAVVAVRAELSATPYDDAIAAAIDPATWQVAGRSDTTVKGTRVTCIAGVAIADVSETLPAGTAVMACLADVGDAGTVTIRTAGAEGDPAFAAQSAVVTLMTLASTFTPPG
ncbi:MAG TPA: META domain-containing protein [Candidatus Limnocylindrales bacterium]|nr:META domain-containing protein [Candidatus Limnocylindrales bacterium]